MGRMERTGEWVFSMLLWVFGGTFYFFVEVVWKTLSGNQDGISWTMLLLAIFLCIPLERLGCELPWEMSLLVQSVLCAIGITATEFVAGCMLNIWLGLNVWDYSAMPFNLWGQICIPFMGLWAVLSAFAIVVFDWMRYAVQGGVKPHYQMRVI